LLVVGCWLLVVGCWLLVVGCWLLVVGCWLLVVGCWLLGYLGCISINMNKIIFLGTGNANNLERQLTSILFVTDKRNFLVDCGDGMGTVRQVEKAGIDPLSVNDFFITHRHTDHLIGLPHFLFVRLVRDEKAKVRVFGPKEALKIAEKICFETQGYLLANKSRIAFIPVKNHESVRLVPGLTVEAGLVASPPGKNLKTFAYKVVIDGKSIVYSSDMRPSAGFDKFVSGSEILIHECFGLDEHKTNIKRFGHSSAREAGECARKAGVKHLILTHLPEERVERKINLLNEARKYFGGKISIAEDLMEFII
jgi:ribonuclease Z